LNVYDDAFADALRRANASAEDLGLVCTHIGDEGADFGTPDVDPYDDLVASDELNPRYLVPSTGGRRRVSGRRQQSLMIAKDGYRK
jgi:hypothetical protein